MNNDDKRNFIINAHSFYMEYRPYDVGLSLEEIKENENKFWASYYSRFGTFFPKTLYKYRQANKKAIECLENDTAWFSHPIDFDDTMDSAINNDIEQELKEFQENPSKFIKEIFSCFIVPLFKTIGIPIDESKFDEVFPLYNKDGLIDEDATMKYLQENMPEFATKKNLRKIKSINPNILINKDTKHAIKGFLQSYIDMNKTIKTKVVTLSLAEDGDNQAMWGLYANESKGFCIEYEFPSNDFLGQRMLLNLMPIYYGEKPLIAFKEVLKHAINSEKAINGVAFEDYQDWFVSTFTKDKTYEFQKEWRISFDDRFGGNMQDFPFAKSIILGEKISKAYKQKLIDIAKVKGLSVYQRKLNNTGSHISVDKIL